MFEKQKNKNELMEVLNADSLKVMNFDDVITKDSISFPLADLAALGASFSSIASIIALTGKGASDGKLYKAFLTTPGTLAKKDGMNLGAVQKGKGVVSQSRFKEVGTAAKTASSASMICMAIAIMAINQSLKNISENQKNILTFLETDKQTQLKGDLLILSEIINDYQ